MVAHYDREGYINFLCFVYPSSFRLNQEPISSALWFPACITHYDHRIVAQRADESVSYFTLDDVLPLLLYSRVNNKTVRHRVFTVSLNAPFVDLLSPGTFEWAVWKWAEYVGKMLPGSAFGDSHPLSSVHSTLMLKK